MGRAVLLDQMAGLAEADIALAALADARELVAVNALRGPRPIVAVASHPVGTGFPGPWFERLARAFSAG